MMWWLFHASGPHWDHRFVENPSMKISIKPLFSPTTICVWTFEFLWSLCCPSQWGALLTTAVNCKLKRAAATAAKSDDRHLEDDYHEDHVDGGSHDDHHYHDYDENNVDCGDENYEEEELALVYSQSKYLVPFSRALLLNMKLTRRHYRWWF